MGRLRSAKTWWGHGDEMNLPLIFVIIYEKGSFFYVSDMMIVSLFHFNKFISSPVRGVFIYFFLLLIAVPFAHTGRARKVASICANPDKGKMDVVLDVDAPLTMKPGPSTDKEAFFSNSGLPLLGFLAAAIWKSFMKTRQMRPMKIPVF